MLKLNHVFNFASKRKKAKMFGSEQKRNEKTRVRESERKCSSLQRVCYVVCMFFLSQISCCLSLFFHFNGLQPNELFFCCFLFFDCFFLFLFARSFFLCKFFDSCLSNRFTDECVTMEVHEDVASAKK